MDIKELAKKLCDESGCHHKCKEIDECVVMEEAEELLISQDKSNNFDVKSNNELFKQALVEGVNRRIDKTIEKEKQIIEIKECIDEVYGQDCAYYDVDGFAIAEEIYNAGYRKQSEGEWIYHECVCSCDGLESGYSCSCCGAFIFDDVFEDTSFPNKYCPNCGSKMKGE